MGRKRARVPGEPRNANAGDVTPAQHTNTFEDVVRGQREVQFALQKRVDERSKRRKLVAEQAALGPSPAKPPIDPRAAGLDVWRRAAERRNQLRKAAAPATDDDNNDDANANDTQLLDAKTGAKIVDEARRQRRELRDERTAAAGPGAAAEAGAQRSSIEAVLKGLGSSAGSSRSGGAHGGSGGDDDDDDDDDDDSRSVALTDFDARSMADDAERDLDFLDGSRITEEEEVALSLFTHPAPANAGPPVDDGGEEEGDDPGPNGGKIMLADIIMAKIREKEEADARAAAEAADPERAARDRKIAEVYGLVGNIMARYRSGRVPKALKVVPKMQNWEELIYLTRPDGWSPAAVYIATRVLASNLSAKEVVRYYSDILLPRCLEDIADNKKLNYHLYRALEKAVYKPEAFSKGILFPLCEDRGVTFRQASIIASVITKMSIPMLHSAAALLHIAQLPFSPTVSAVIKALIEKKYALPYRVVDTIVDSFVRMKDDERAMPLLWHQCLLAFAQHYKVELTAEQKNKLKVLMRVHTHAGITPEIRRELFSTRNRGEVVDPDANTIARNIANATAMVDV